MKKIFSILAVLVLSAATSFAQITIGAGYAHNIATSKVGDSSPAKALTDGFYVEGGYQFQLADIVTFNPTLRYTFLTSGESNSIAVPIIGTLTGSARLTEHYLSIPAMFELNLELNNGRFFMFAGPTFELGLASNLKLSASAYEGLGSYIHEAFGLGSKANMSIDLYRDKTYNRFDALIGGGIGFQFGKFIIKAGYNYGMVDRNKTSKVTLHDQQIYGGVAFTF